VFEVEVRNGRELIRRETLCEKEVEYPGKKKGGAEEEMGKERFVKSREPT